MPEQTESQRRAQEVSAITDDVLDDCDRVLKSMCGFKEDEVVDADRFAVQAKKVCDEYQQKGGQ